MASDLLQSAYRRTWWSLVLRGILSIAVGVIILWRPAESIAALALLIAIWALVSGIVQIVHALDLRAVFSQWWVMLVSGLVGVGFGVAALYYYPGLSLGFAVAWTMWWLLFTAVATYVLFKTKVGNWIFAVGGDQESARAVGVPVTAVKVGLFMFVGFCAWFAGMHLLFAFNTVQSGQGVGNEFIYIIAAVIGGCLLTGGYGTAIGAAIGAFIFGMVQQGIVYAGWNPDWFKFFMGVMLLFAVIANNAFRNYAAKR